MYGDCCLVVRDGGEDGIGNWTNGDKESQNESDDFG
jgi:hypothetical protein